MGFQEALDCSSSRQPGGCCQNTTTMTVAAAVDRRPHAVIFPFMAKGHIIPHLQLARLLLNRGLAVTVITTPANRPFCDTFLVGTSASVISIPFPTGIPHIPDGVESTDRLPSFSLFARFAVSTKLMQPAFDSTLRSLLPVSFIVSDGFLPWTYYSALSHGVPRFAFYGMSNHAFVVNAETAHGNLLQSLHSEDDPFILPSFPWMQLTPNDFDDHVRNPHLDYHYSCFVNDSYESTTRSQGLIVNSFRELEPGFLDHWNKNFSPKATCVGPLCLTEETTEEGEYKGWLDQNLTEGKTVVYVSFGSQAEMSAEQVEEIAAGLEEAGVSFLWAVKRGGGDTVGEEYEERVKGRGVVARGWVNQRAVLSHGGVGVFVSHCGWNSVIEAVCSGVAVAACPLASDQHLNARMVVEELGVGVRVETTTGSVRGFVGREGVKKALGELMEGEKGKDARKKAAALRLSAVAAVADGGSSSTSLDDLISEYCCHHV